MKRTTTIFRSGIAAAAFGTCVALAGCADERFLDSALPDENSVAEKTFQSSTPYDSLVISKIFFAAHSKYFRDCYIRITNNSSHDVDVSNLVVLESKFKSASAYFNFSDSIALNDFVTEVVYQIPPTEILPSGQSLVLADEAIDHSDGGVYDAYVNLERANYAWTNTGTSAAVLMTKVFSYSQSYWQLHTRGYCAYAIAQLRVDTATFLANYKYTGTYDVLVHRPDGTDTVYVMTTTNAYSVPNSWIIDAVHVAGPSAAERILQTIPLALDAGYTYAGDPTGVDPTLRYEKCVTRKIDSVTEKFIDTDNSTNDFIPNDTNYLEPIPQIMRRQ
jgi:hypothetical protein